jgi:hypothetical protein
MVELAAWIIVGTFVCVMLGPIGEALWKIHYAIHTFWLRRFFAQWSKDHPPDVDALEKRLEELVAAWDEQARKAREKNHGP